MLVHIAYLHKYLEQNYKYANDGKTFLMISRLKSKDGHNFNTTFFKHTYLYMYVYMLSCLFVFLYVKIYFIYFSHHFSSSFIIVQFILYFTGLSLEKMF